MKTLLGLARRILVLLLLFVAVSRAAERNIVFFITDDESPTLGCYGDNVAVTPAIDRLAEDGTVFDHAFATTASCSASRSCVLSGLYNHKSGQYGHEHHFHKFTTFLDAASLTLPHVLAAEGYRTARIGKFHVGPEPVYHFETVLRGNTRNALQMADVCETFIKAEDERPFFLYFATSDPHRGGGTDRTWPGKLKPDLFGNKPGKGSHQGVKEVFFDPAKVPVPAFLPDTPECRSELAQYYQSCARIDRGLERLVGILKEAGVYDKTLIVFTSDHGMAFAGAKTTVYQGGLRVPFVVRNPYAAERGVRCDAMITHVDIAPSLLDFAGGLDGELNRPKKWRPAGKLWAGTPMEKGWNRSGGAKFDRYHGRSWVSILEQEAPGGWDEIFASHTFHEITMYYPMRVVQDRDYKLIFNIAHGLPYPFASDLWASSTWQAQLAKGGDAPYGTWTVDGYVNRPRFELFDVQKDQWEGTNLAKDPAFADVLAKYQARLKALQKRHDDPWIMKWRYE
jgi:N-sulfoglucosamine sulfohydrolase